MIGVIFDDKRVTCSLLMIWMTVVLAAFSHIGIMKTSFMKFGPSDDCTYMGLPINNWFRWYCVAIFTFVSTSINDFVSDAIVPWIQNTIQDHKAPFLPYRKMTCWLISQIWSLYCCVMGLFSINIMFSQVDFNIIRGTADLAVNSFTTYLFLQNKHYAPLKYKQLYEETMDKSEACSKMSVADNITRELDSFQDDTKQDESSCKEEGDPESTDPVKV